jgi:CDP-glycerol glycerophosphotransferase (TagB/SpsB family)
MKILYSKSIQLVVAVLSHFTSLLVPRSERIWVFGGNLGKRFADNSRYFFIYCSNNYQERCIWLSLNNKIVRDVKAMGYEAYNSHSFKGLYYGFRAKWHIVDVTRADTSYFSSIGAKIFNMWHGIPIKNLGKIRPDQKIKSFLKNLLIRNNSNKNIYMSFPNSKFSHHFQDAFGIPKRNIIISNQPRNTVLYNDNKANGIYRTKNEDEALENLKRLKSCGAKIIGYFPTWRTGGKENFLGITDFSLVEDLNSLLAKNNAFILCKRHTCSYRQYQHSGYSEQSEKNEEQIRRLGRFIFLEYDIDLNSVIQTCDLLISDYSGVIIDYLLLDRPIILYTYDYDQYQSSPGLYFDLRSEFKFGKIANNMSELISLTSEFLRNTDSFSSYQSNKRKELRNQFFETEECFKNILERIRG